MRIFRTRFMKRSLMMSLQSLCVDVIVSEFERYYLCFSKSDDANVKRMFEFLQRKYSYQIASQLFEEDKMQNHYLDFIVNKYLKILDSDWFKDCEWKTITAKFAEIGSNLEKIYFSELHEEGQWEDIICHLSNLEIVTFHSGCNDEFLRCIAKYCPNIVEIDVTSSCDVTDEGIKHLCKKENGKMSCPKLKKLYIANSNVNEAGIVHLIENLRSLEITDYHDLPQVLYSVHKNDLSELDKIEPYNLSSLNLFTLNVHVNSVPFYTDLLKVCLSVCPHLKSFSCPILKSEHLDLFPSLNELEKLHIECPQNCDVNISNFLKLRGRKLTFLTIDHGSLSVSSLAESCPGLKFLHLNQVNFQNNSDISPVFQRLETCAFNFTLYDSSTAQSISLLLKSSRVLEQIIFKWCDLSSSELKADILACCECCPIKKISFTGSVLEMNFVKAILLNCHSLMCLSLDRCDLDSEEELELYRFAQLLPNNPEIYFSDELSMSDMNDDNLYNFYELDDDFDAYDDYDDFSHYDDDDDEDDDDDDYGCYFEL